MKLLPFLKQSPEAILDSYVISEIGNNHGGSYENAQNMVRQSSICGVSAVKFQKRNNKELFTPEFYDMPYDNPNSFGATYGLHRDNLELSIHQLAGLKSLAEELGLDFIVTPFDFTSLEELESIDCPIYKIASADLVNIPLIRAVASTKKPIILSTGASDIDDISRALKELEDHPFTPVVLHCTAAYPCPIENMNLNCISALRKQFISLVIGLSDHENGIDAAPLAYMLGARVFEKHFTLDHAWKGTDNCFSLMPKECDVLCVIFKESPCFSEHKRSRRKVSKKTLSTRCVNQ